MESKLIIKNHQNYFFTVVGFLALIILTFINLVLLITSILQFSNPISAIAGVSSLFPFVLFFGGFLYLWLWDTFGKTEIIIAEDLSIIHHNKLFSKPKHINFTSIKSVEFVDLSIERTKFRVRYHPFNNKAVKINTVNESFYAVKFVNEKEAVETLNFIEANLKKSNV